MPPGVVTWISTVPADSGGAATEIELSPLTVRLVIISLPKFTSVAPVKPLPVIVTTVPPLVGPVDGEIPFTTGRGGGVVAVGVGVGVEVSVTVGVGVGVEVSVTVGVGVGVEVSVTVGVGVGVEVSVTVGEDVTVVLSAPTGNTKISTKMNAAIHTKDESLTRSPVERTGYPEQLMYS
jgi:hypothetical protein